MQHQFCQRFYKRKFQGVISEKLAPRIVNLPNCMKERKKKMKLTLTVLQACTISDSGTCELPLTS